MKILLLLISLANAQLGVESMPSNTIFASTSVFGAANTGAFSNPQVTFAGDTDSGLFSTSAGVLGLSADGAATLRVDSDQVSIGTNAFSSGYSLTISDPAPDIVLADSNANTQNATGGIYFGAGPTQNYGLELDGNGGLQLYNNCTTDCSTSLLFNGAAGTELSITTNTFSLLNGVASISRAGLFTTTGTITSTSSGSIGWNPVNAANQACNTTCTNGCVIGLDTSAAGNFLACDNAAADTCLCAGAN